MKILIVFFFSLFFFSGFLGAYLLPAEFIFRQWVQTAVSLQSKTSPSKIFIRSRVTASGDGLTFEEVLKLDLVHKKITSLIFLESQTEPLLGVEKKFLEVAPGLQLFLRVFEPDSSPLMALFESLGLPIRVAPGENLQQKRVQLVRYGSSPTNLRVAFQLRGSHAVLAFDQTQFFPVFFSHSSSCLSFFDVTPIGPLFFPKKILFEKEKGSKDFLIAEVQVTQVFRQWPSHLSFSRFEKSGFSVSSPLTGDFKKLIEWYYESFR